MSEFLSFQKVFKGDIVVPSHPDYNAAIARWAPNAERKAKIIAFVKDAADFSAAIKFSKASELPLAIRGGGHSCSGASSSQDGIVIDLSRHLNGVRIDPKNELVYVSGGAVWSTVDKAAIKHGLAGVGGTVNHTGVGGLTLGGGMGFLTGAHGLVVDNLKQVTLVTADGSILIANDTTNPDLSWAIRGSGSNFGVVTEFIYQLHPQCLNVYAGLLIYPSAVLDKLIQVMAEWWANGKGPSEKEAVLQLLTRGPDRTPCIVLLVFYNGSEEEGRTVYKRFLDLKLTADTTKEIPYKELNTLQNPFAGHGVPTYLKGGYQPNPLLEVSAKAFSRLVELTDDRPDIEMTIMVEYYSLLKTNSVPGDATAHQHVPYPNVVNIIRWKENTSENIKWAQILSRKIMEVFTKEVEDVSMGLRVDGYGNYDSDADGGTGVPVSDKVPVLFGANYPKLQQLKKLYDPEMLFSKWFPIHP